MCKTANLFDKLHVATFLIDTLVITLDSGAQRSDKYDVLPYPNPVVLSKEVYINPVLYLMLMICTKFYSSWYA